MKHHTTAPATRPDSERGPAPSDQGPEPIRCRGCGSQYGGSLDRPGPLVVRGLPGRGARHLAGPWKLRIHMNSQTRAIFGYRWTGGSLPRCYGHNRPYRDCPTKWGCAWRQALSRLGWGLIHLTMRRKPNATP